ncbi:unnamed protein product [Cylicocyclus nassatus]|uniref:Uncharacterized protein n=1 Tax=Cylicocyclus nassatus TaxID=53992 RepID=A0AA36GXN9_CYLNA|nr:unnamed protein product [Cylicocyclus nassatus]
MVLLGISPYITCSVLSGSYLLRSSDIKADKLCKELQALGDELSKVLPSVSSHIMQFSRWMESVRKTCLNLEHINREPNEYPVGSEDITRQQQLITLNEYIMRMAASTSSHHKPPQTCTTVLQAVLTARNCEVGPIASRAGEGAAYEADVYCQSGAFGTPRLD